MVMPRGGSTTATYLELTAPTFVIVLVRVVEFLRAGMVIEGRFMSRIEGCFMGQNVGCSISWEMAEFL